MMFEEIPLSIDYFHSLLILLLSEMFANLQDTNRNALIKTFQFHVEFEVNHFS